MIKSPMIKMKFSLLRKFLTTSLLLCSFQIFAEVKIDDEKLKTLFDTYDKESSSLKGKNYFIKRGVRANKKTREVEIFAVASGIKKGEPIEYMLVRNIGKDYESLAVTLANASDVKAALEFVSIKSGYNVNHHKMQFWPKGDRVDVFVKKDDKLIPGNEIFHDSRNSKPLEAVGWMFDGSYILDKRLAAEDSGDIISMFNSISTLLDVPYQAPKGPRMIVPNPAHLFSAMQPVKFIIRPRFAPGKTNVQSYTVKISFDKVLHFTVIDGKKTIAENVGFEKFLETLNPSIKMKKDIYIKFNYDAKMPVIQLININKIINQFVISKIFRVEIYKDQFFYAAFNTKKDMLVPKNRSVQPVEIHIHGKETGRLRIYTETYLENDELLITKTDHVYKSYEDLKKLLTLHKGEQWKTLNIFLIASAETSYDELETYYDMVKKDLPLIFIFAK
ncbi:MAG: hypothetical protein HRT89_08245 [Lentisphaeria bacterium]|nr:YdjY domain-containing protein [Lentisphaeria bacterium]NQZ68045.1 hypothetical protein [Lentisphaeria bacterium]